MSSAALHKEVSVRRMSAWMSPIFVSQCSLEFSCLSEKLIKAGINQGKSISEQLGWVDKGGEYLAQFSLSLFLSLVKW